MSPLAEHREARQPCPPILIDIDVVLQRPPPPRRRQPDIVGHRAAGDEHSAPRRRQGEELLQPVDGDDFHPRAEWRGGPHPGVLIECGRQPLGRQRSRGCPTDDEMEEATASRTDRGIHPRIDQLPHRLQRAVAILRQRSSEGWGYQLRGRRPHRSVGERGDVASGCLMNQIEGLVDVAEMIDRIGHLMHSGHSERDARCPRHPSRPRFCRDDLDTEYG